MELLVRAESGNHKIREKIENGSVRVDDAFKINSYGLNTSDIRKYFSENRLNEKYKKAVMRRDIERWIIKRHKFVYYDPKILTRLTDEQPFLSKELIMQESGQV